MKASELIEHLTDAMDKLGDREVVAHSADADDVEQSKHQFLQISFGVDAAIDSKNMPFELWFIDNKEVADEL